MIKVTTNPYRMFSFTEDDNKPLIDVSKYKGLINIPDKKITINVYLHGTVENKAGFDIPMFLEGDYVEEGIHDVEVLLSNETIKCKMYLWNYVTKNVTSNIDGGYYGDWTAIQGLIVDINDTSGIEDAELKYKDKPEFF